MCMIDDADPAEFMVSDIRKARKDHKCAECGRIIKVGEKYTHSTILYDGRFEHNKRCSHCEAAADWLLKHCGGWCYGAMLEEIEEHFNSGYREENLRRLLIGMRRKWAAFRCDGLLPVLAISEQD